MSNALIALAMFNVLLLALLWWSDRGARQSYRDGWDHSKVLFEVELERLRSELKAAQERLLAAWKDGYAIPADTSEPLAEAPDARFSDNQNAWLDQWEDPNARDRWARFLTARMRTGRSPDGAIADAEIQLVTGQERLWTPQPTADLRDAG